MCEGNPPPPPPPDTNGRTTTVVQEGDDDDDDDDDGTGRLRVTPASRTAHHRHRHRHRRRRASPGRSAVDSPPPVVGRERQQQQRSLVHQTPEFLATLRVPSQQQLELLPQQHDASTDTATASFLTSCCRWSPSVAPLIVNHGGAAGTGTAASSFLVAATTTGHVCVWSAGRILSSPSSSSSPQLSSSETTNPNNNRAGGEEEEEGEEENTDQLDEEQLSSGASLPGALAPDCVIDTMAAATTTTTTTAAPTSKRATGEGRRRRQQQQQQETSAANIPPPPPPPPPTTATRMPIVGLAVFPPSRCTTEKKTDGGGGDRDEPIRIATVTDMGDVCIAQITTTADENNETATTSESMAAKGRILFRFQSGRCCVTDIAVVVDDNDSPGDDDREKRDRVVLTYASSHLEVWSVPRRCCDDTTTAATSGDEDSNTNDAKKMNKGDVNSTNRPAAAAELTCRACFQSGFPIRSVVQLQFSMPPPQPPNNNIDDDIVEKQEVADMKTQYWDEEAETNTNCADADVTEDIELESGKNNGNDNDNTTKKEYLIITLQPERQRSSASMVEVVDLSSLEAAWKKEEESADKIREETLQLEDHWVLPAAGMEIADASSLRRQPATRDGTTTGTGAGTGTNARAPPVHWIPSAGTDCLLSLYSSPSSSSALDKNENAFSRIMACALSDGTVCILSAKPNSQNDQQLSWGVFRDTDQTLLSYPPIGLGMIEMATRSPSSKEEYLVCCLRGGTAYLIPLISSNNTGEEQRQSPSTPIRVIGYPHDIDTVTSPVQHVQGFTAGNLVQHHCYNGGVAAGYTAAEEEEKVPSTPVLVYAWPGGLIDVYSCGLRKKVACPRSVCRLLVDNGSAKMLHTLLSSFPSRVELRDRGPDWQGAYDEIRKHAATSNTSSSSEQESPVPLTLEEICSDRFKAFRSLLLDLAET